MGDVTNVGAQVPESPAADLRVTVRCCTEDLGADPDSTLGSLAAAHPMVEKFRAVRSQLPVGQERIQSIGSIPVYSLHSGRDRGATLHDRWNSAVWLLASRIHRAGDASDAYLYFEQLHDSDRLLPVHEDYDRLFTERDRRIVASIVYQLRSLRVEARRKPEAEVSTVLADGTRVSAWVIVAHPEPAEGGPSIQEAWLVLQEQNLRVGWLDIIRSAFLPEEPPSSWEWTRELPWRKLASDEIAFRHRSLEFFPDE